MASWRIQVIPDTMLLWCLLVYADTGDRVDLVLARPHNRMHAAGIVALTQHLHEGERHSSQNKSIMREF
jgi:hypothetical protein